MSFKSIASSVLQSVAHVSGASVMRGRQMNLARIFMFHGIGDAIYSAEIFEAQLKFLKRHFEIIRLESLLERLTVSDAKLGKSVVLTFDDGLRNNFSVAYPILKRLNVPATFFVCPGLIEGRCWLWNQEARARLQSLDSSARAGLAACWALADSDVEKIIGWMKTLPINERFAREEELGEATLRFQPTPEQRIQCDVMYWDELQSLDSKLITIGSHSVNHPILSTLRPDELQFEIRESRRLLEEKLSRPVEFFCYPNGMFDPNIVAETKKYYSAAVTTEPGFATPTNDRHLLPRIGSTEKNSLLTWRLHRPTA